jgi:hypothetical protein
LCERRTADSACRDGSADTHQLEKPATLTVYPMMLISTHLALLRKSPSVVERDDKKFFTTAPRAWTAAKLPRAPRCVNVSRTLQGVRRWRRVELALLAPLYAKVIATRVACPATVRVREIAPPAPRCTKAATVLDDPELVSEQLDVAERARKYFCNRTRHGANAQAAVG